MTAEWFKASGQDMDAWNLLELLTRYGSSYGSEMGVMDRKEGTCTEDPIPWAAFCVFYDV